jgi:hypothetical protein
MAKFGLVTDAQPYFTSITIFWQFRQQIGHTKTVLLPLFLELLFFFAIIDSCLERDLLWQSKLKHTLI